MGDAYADGRLPSLVFVDSNQTNHLVYIGLVKTCRFDLLLALVLFHVTLYDFIQYVVGRQAVLVGLVLTQLRTGRSGDDALRDRCVTGLTWVVGVAPMGQLVDQCF